MPVEDTTVVDAVRKAEDGKIVVVITDEGKIADPKERVACLVQKLKAYINNIVSGDLKKEYPENTARDFMIEVFCRHRPTEEMMSISEVMPRKDPANKVPVRFVEFPPGAWGAVKVARQDGAAPAPVAASRGGVERLDPLSEAALEKGAEVADNYLAEGQREFYFAVLGWDEDKTEVVYFREAGVTDEIVREVDQYVRDLTLAFTVCVLVSVGNLKKYRRGNKEAVLLALHRRGRQMARVYAKPMRRKGVLHSRIGADSLELVGSKTGLFPF